MIYTDKTKRAIKLCFKAHEGKYDKSGLPYVHHPLHIAEQMHDEDSTIVALLHDVVEDTDYTIKDINGMGFGDAVTEALQLLTHNPTEDYMYYIEKLSDNPLARLVKIYDLEHNSDLSRLNHEPTEKDIKRIEKYGKAKWYLIRKQLGDEFDEEPLSQYEESNYIKWVKESLIDDYHMSVVAADTAIEKFDLKNKINDFPMIARHDDPRNTAGDIAERYLPMIDFIKCEIVLRLEYSRGIKREETYKYLEDFDLERMIKEKPEKRWYEYVGEILCNHPDYKTKENN